MIIDIVIAVVAVLFLGVYVSWRAGRLDRMHTRLQAARAALDVTLVRRSSVALELASSGFLDPATSLLLASAAHEARGQVRSGSGQPPAELAPGRAGTRRAERAPSWPWLSWPPPSGGLVSGRPANWLPTWSPATSWPAVSWPRATCPGRCAPRSRSPGSAPRWRRRTAQAS